MASRTSSVSQLFRNKEFLALASTAFARSQAYSTVLIALAMYADLFHTTSTVEGLFGTAFALAQLVIVLPLGRYIDISNSKRFLLAGLLVNVAVFGGFMLVGSVEHVILVRVVQGVGASLLWLTGSAVVGEISPQGSRGLWLGTYNQVAAFSSLAGDIVGGVLLYTYGFQLTYAVLIGVTTIAAVAVFFFLRDNPGGKTDPNESTGYETLHRLLDRPMIRALVGFRLAFSLSKMAVIIFVPIYAKTAFGINPFLIGGILAGGKLTKTLLQGTMGDLTDGASNRSTFVIVGALVYALGISLVPLAGEADQLLTNLTVAGFGHEIVFSPAFMALFGAYSVLGVGDSIRLPASMTLFVEEGERFDSVASSMSLRSISWKAGQIVGPVAVGAVWDATSVHLAFWLAAAFALIAAGLFVALVNANPIRDNVPAVTVGD